LVNEYQLWLEDKGKYGLFRLQMNMWCAGKTVKSLENTLDPKIDRVDRSSRSFDNGVELSRRISEKSSQSIESIVRLWSWVSRLYTKI